MGKGAEDGSADCRACAVCTRVCQTTHGKGLPYSVPRFHKVVPDYSTPASRNCYMQVPTGYVREHIGKGAKQSYVLEGVTGSEWEVTFNNIGLCGGWKTFAIDYHLEKGDQVMFGLVAPKRFFVNVFNKFGTEKFGTRDPLNRRGSTGTVIDKEIHHMLPRNGNQVSNSTSVGAEDLHTPLQLEHGERCGEQKSNGVDEFPSGTTSPQHNAQFLKSNGVSADSRPVKVSGQNENHEGVHEGGTSGSKLLDDPPSEDANSPQVGPRLLNRTLEFDPTRASIKKLLIRDPVECDELEPSAMSDSMSESEDSVQVLLAKAVLAKVRRKKLKKRKSSCTPTQVEMVTEATKSGGTFRTEVSTPSLNEDKAVNLKSRNGDWTSKNLARLETDNVTDSSRDDETGARGETELEEAMHEKSCEEPRVRVDGSNGQTESQMCSIQAQPHQERINGAGDSNGDELQEPQNIDNGVRGEVVQEIPQPDHSQTEGMAMGTLTATAGVVNEEDSVLKRAEERSNQPSPVFQAALVKEEPDLRDDLGPEMTAAGAHNEACANCGLATIPEQDQIFAPPTNLICENPETRSPSSIAPSPPRGNVRVTENQKQKALVAAKTFSDNTKNPSAVVVMRISFVEKTCACFVSVKCAEMLPRAPTELILVDGEGYVRKANWRPERRYMQGLGWKDFVDSNNLQVNDVCVMEVIDESSQQFKVLIHIFHAHEMNTEKHTEKHTEKDTQKDTEKEKETEKENERKHTPPIAIALPIAEASPGARTRSEEKRSQGASQLYGLLPSKRRKRRKKSPTNEAVETELLTMPAYTDDEITKPGMQLTVPSTEEAKGNPGTEPSKEQDEQGSPDSIPPTDPSHEERNSSKRERKKVRMLLPLTAPKKFAQGDSIRISNRKRQDGAELEKHEPVQTLRADKWNGSRRQYSVAKLVDRRKSLHGVVFLVELKETVTQSSGHKKVKAKQDEKGRWWVPHNHFTSDFSSCYIE